MRDPNDLMRQAEALGIGVPPGLSRAELEGFVTGAERRAYCTRCGELASIGPDRCSACGAPLPATRDDLVGSGSPPATVVPRVDRFFHLDSGATAMVRVFMFIAIGVSLLAAAVVVNEANQFDAWWNAPSGNDELQFANWANAEFWSGIAILVDVVVLAALVILLMVWGNRAYKDLLTLQPATHRWGPRWAVGGWFIPIGGYFIVKMVFNEIDRISHPGNAYPVGASWRRHGVLLAGNLWWVLVLAGGVITSVAISVASAEIDALAMFSSNADGYRRALWALAGGFVVEAVAWFFGARYFKILGGRFHRRQASNGPSVGQRQATGADHR